MRNIILIITATLCIGCDDGHNHDHDHDHHNREDIHGHKAPHGGMLVNVENEFCHLEFVREPGVKRLQMHAMRFHPSEGPVKFYVEKVEATEESRIYILKNNSELKEVEDSDFVLQTSPDNIGIHVPRIADVINVEKDGLNPVPANINHPFYKYVARFNDEFITILEPFNMLNLNEQ